MEVSNKIMFTIIIPCYNVEKYIKHTIDSVLNQSYRNYEVILVNDCSTDNTLTIIRDYDRLEKFKILNTVKNSGVSVARNLGISEARGEFLVFLDGDDLFRSDMLECISREITVDNTLEFISFGYKRNSVKNVVSYSVKKYNKILFSSNDFIELFLNRKVYQSMCSFVCKRSVIVENHILFLEGIRFGEDIAFQLECMKSVVKILYLSEELFSYLIREESVTNQKFNVNNLDGLYALNSLREHFKNYSFYNSFNNYIVYSYLHSLISICKSKKYDIIVELQKYDVIVFEKRVTFKIEKISLIAFVFSKLYLLNKNLFVKSLKFIIK